MFMHRCVVLSNCQMLIHVLDPGDSSPLPLHTYITTNLCITVQTMCDGLINFKSYNFIDKMYFNQ